MEHRVDVFLIWPWILFHKGFLFIILVVSNGIFIFYLKKLWSKFGGNRQSIDHGSVGL